jgi:hypothetical protein
MANKVTGGIRRLDTFGVDRVVDTGILSINAIVATVYGSSAKTVTFIDNDAAPILVMEVDGGTTEVFSPADPVKFGNGFTFDESASDVANSSDFVFIFCQD